MNHKGFSLIELVIVLILLSLSISLVAPSFSRLSKTVELKATAKKISGILRYYRSEAVQKGKIQQILFDLRLREIRIHSIEAAEEKDSQQEGKVAEKKYALPEGIQIKEVKVPVPQVPSELPSIEFYPNGGSNGGTILLGNQDQKEFKIKVNFLTGMVGIEES